MTPHVIFYINCCHFFFDFSRDKGKDKKQCVLAVMGRVWQVIISCFDSRHIFDVFINFTSLLILFQIFEKSLSFSTVHYCLSFYLQNPDSNMAELRLTKPAPEFKGQAVVDGEFKDISLANYKGKYLVLFFYPLDL